MEINKKDPDTLEQKGGDQVVQYLQTMSRHVHKVKFVQSAQRGSKEDAGLQ